MQPHNWDSQSDGLARPEALLTAQETWEVSPQQLTPDELIQACRAAVRQRDWWNALLWADRGLAHEAVTVHQEGILRFAAGLALTYVGDLFRAERELRQFLRLAQQEQALSKLVGDAAYNLGYVYRTLHQHEHELAWFESALTWYREARDEDNVVLTLADIAWSHLIAGSPAAAEPFLLEAMTLLAGRFDYDRPDIALDWALYHSLNGDLARSESFLRKAEESWQIQARYRAEIAWIRGANLLAEHDMDGAQVQLALAYEHALEDWWPEQMARIDQLQVRMLRRNAM